MYILDECEVCRSSEERATITRVKDKGWKQDTGGGVLRAYSYEKRARSKLICACVYFAHVVCKTATSRTQTSTKRRVSHTPLKYS